MRPKALPSVHEHDHRGGARGPFEGDRGPPSRLPSSSPTAPIPSGPSGMPPISRRASGIGLVASRPAASSSTCSSVPSAPTPRRRPTIRGHARTRVTCSRASCAEVSTLHEQSATIRYQETASPGGTPMTWLPPAVVELLEAALVTELSVVRPDGRPMTYPLIPLWDGERVLMTSSVLFSQQARAHQVQPARLARAQRPGRARRPHRPRHDPGHRPGRRRRPAHRVGTRPPALAGEGAGHPRVPQGSRGVPALLRARRHRGRADSRLLLAGRGHPDGAPGHVGSAE